jgi:hypothetical protein
MRAVALYYSRKIMPKFCDSRIADIVLGEEGLDRYRPPQVSMVGLEAFPSVPLSPRRLK